MNLNGILAIVDIFQSVWIGLGVFITDDMVDSYKRLGIKSAQPRSIIVKFNRKIFKKEILMKKVIISNFFTHDIGFTNTHHRCGIHK